MLAIEEQSRSVAACQPVESRDAPTSFCEHQKRCAVQLESVSVQEQSNKKEHNYF
jgi:hypothetical protein